MCIPNIDLEQQYILMLNQMCKNMKFEESVVDCSVHGEQHAINYLAMWLLCQSVYCSTSCYVSPKYKQCPAEIVLQERVRSKKNFYLLSVVRKRRRESRAASSYSACCDLQRIIVGFPLKGRSRTFWAASSKRRAAWTPEAPGANCHRTSLEMSTTETRDNGSRVQSEKTTKTRLELDWSTDGA